MPGGIDGRNVALAEPAQLSEAVVIAADLDFEAGGVGRNQIGEIVGLRFGHAEGVLRRRNKWSPRRPGRSWRRRRRVTHGGAARIVFGSRKGGLHFVFPAPHTRSERDAGEKVQPRQAQAA